MITQEMLNQECFKHRLQQREAKVLGLNLPINPAVRRSETVHGFLSVEEATRLLKGGDKNLMINGCGLAAVSDDTVVFLAGDPGYGYETLKPWRFIGMSQRLPCHMPNADDERVKDGVMTTAEEFLGVYFDDRVHLNSLQELLDYLNHGRLPQKRVADCKALSEAANRIASA